MNNFLLTFLSNGNMMFFLGLLFAMCLLAVTLGFISRVTKYGLKRYWGELNLFEHDMFIFFIAKTSAYRRILYFFTVLSYGLRIVSVLTTFFIIYCLVDQTAFSNALLVLAALCDGINLLFPFQKYVDLFSECCIQMENCILLNNQKILDKNIPVDSNLLSQIYDELCKEYIKCENLIHTQNRI